MLSLRNLAALTVSCLLVGVGAGCGGSPVPTGPAAPSPPPPPPPPPPPQAPPAVSASLAIEDASVIVRRNHRGSWSETRFLLRETGGSSGAEILEVTMRDRSGEANSEGSSCWRDKLRVPPGGVLDTFYTDAGWDWLGYCAPGVPTPVEVIVRFADDDGRLGRVSAMLN